MPLAKLRHKNFQGTCENSFWIGSLKPSNICKGLPCQYILASYGKYLDFDFNIYLDFVFKVSPGWEKSSAWPEGAAAQCPPAKNICKLEL